MGKIIELIEDEKWISHRSIYSLILFCNFFINFSASLLYAKINVFNLLIFLWFSFHQGLFEIRSLKIACFQNFHFLKYQKLLNPAFCNYYLNKCKTNQIISNIFCNQIKNCSFISTHVEFPSAYKRNNKKGHR